MPPPHVPPGVVPILPRVEIVKIELTDEIIGKIKEELVQAGLPPKIYRLTHDGDVFIFRPLYKIDQNKIAAYFKNHPQAALDQDANHEQICRCALIFPDTIFHPVEWMGQRAGYAETIAKLILSKSGFYDPDIDQSDMFVVEALFETEQDTPPSTAILEELKLKYSKWGAGLRKIRIDDAWYVVRPLTRLEWKSLKTEEDQEQAIATKACIWSKQFPPNFEDELAGTPRTLANVIHQISGFDLPAQQLQIEAL